MSHRCHAKNCKKEVPPSLFMCFQHWKMVPKPLQAEVWKHYRPGQEIDKNPTNEYLQVTEGAIDHVYRLEALLLIGVDEGDLIPLGDPK